MVYHGRVQDGQIRLDGDPALPEGAQVELNLIEGAAAKTPHRPIEEVLDEIAASIPESEWDKLPRDLTDHLDHYVYGTPKS